MTALTATFDSLSYVRKLEESGFTRQQAEVQAEALRQQTDAQAEALRQQVEIIRQQAEEQRAALRQELQREVQRELERYDETSRQELATKGDVQDVRLEVEKVRTEVEKVRAELKTDIEKVRAELKTDIAQVQANVEKVRYDLLRWQLGIGAAIVSFMLAGFGGIAAIMAKGFHWMGF